jgi:hypothetical protein
MLISRLFSACSVEAEVGPRLAAAPATLSRGRALEGRGGGREEWCLRLVPTYRLCATDVIVCEATSMMMQLQNCDSQNLRASDTRLATDCMLSLLLAPERERKSKNKVAARV